MLSSLMAHDAALETVSGWLAEMMSGWRENPLAHMPFRHSLSGGVGAIELHRVGPVTLSVLVIDPAGITPAQAIAFTDCERHEVVLAGRGRAFVYSFAEDGPPSGRPLDLCPAARFCGNSNHSRAIVELDEPLVLLRLAREPEHPAPTRQVEIATGQIIHRASASPAEGRAELAAGLLGAMGRTDAAPALARYACGQAGEGARWQALRNALALDTRMGFAALCQIADDVSDPIAADAAALRHSLCTSYPQLANLREDLCLAN
tara:strand:+ start:1705 stop:2490 length:786 start_codon:yes stop_codon:yes gene_type:complete